MTKRSSKDISQIARAMAAHVTVQPGLKPAKNPAVVALGRIGGLKSGKARDSKIPEKKQKEIATLAAISRRKEG